MDLATRRMVYYGLIGLLIAGATVTAFQMSPGQILPKDGVLDVYLAGIQSDIPGNTFVSFGPSQSPAPVPLKPSTTILSLNVTIDSVTIHTNSSDGGKTLSISFTFDVMKPFNVTKLISSTAIPEGNVTSVDLHVAKATAAVVGVGLEPVKVPSGTLKIPVSPALHIKAQTRSSIVISGTAHIVVEGNGNIMLTPVLHVAKTTGP